MDRPTCPRHPRSKVVRAGWHGKPPHRRQRWWCRPINGSDPHRFTPALPRLELPSRECGTCHTELEAWEGRQAPRDYTFVAETIARALTRVREGWSYRSAAEDARQNAGRWRHVVLPPRVPGGPTPLDPMRHGQIVADWVEVYTAMLYDELGPKEWTDHVMADAKPVHDGATGARGGRRLFHVLAAVGHNHLGDRAVVRLEAHTQETGITWNKFFRSLPQTPTNICTDGGKAINNGVQMAFGAAPVVRRCEYHLKESLLDKLPAHAPQSLLDKVDMAFLNTQRWAEYRSELDSYNQPLSGFAGAQKWAKTNEQLILHQAATRSSLTPNSVSPVEQVLATLDRSIAAPGRASGFRNAARTNLLLQLITLHANKQANEQRYADIILGQLAGAGGHTKRPQRRIADPYNSRSLR